MNQPFYRAFEERYRGSRELIKSRQQIYLPFIQPLKTLYPECHVLDLGCGRGEWLEVLLENDFRAQGVDLDEGMLESCIKLNLPAERGDALTTLRQVPNESLSVITGFHIAEHLPFSDLQCLVMEALRVLKPAGLLVLETPNVENIVVGTNNFYLDPTHNRPIPYQLLHFLTEHAGFKRTKLLRLQESPELANSEKLSLMDVLNGASPDYAVVAQKAASDQQLSFFDRTFDKEYGLALDVLAQKYETALQGHFAELIQRHKQLTQKVERAENLARSISNQLQQQLQETNLQISRMEQRLRSTYEERLNEISTSFSWWITWPIRALKHAIIWLLTPAARHFKVLIRRITHTTTIRVLRRPQLYRSVASTLNHFPRLSAHLRQFALHHRIISSPDISMNASQSNLFNFSDSEEIDLNLLTPSARKIYDRLSRAVAAKEES